MYIYVIVFRFKPSKCEHPVCANDDILCPDMTMCAPQPLPIFDIIETVCVGIFTFDYVIRILTVSHIPPQYVLIYPL